MTFRGVIATSGLLLVATGLAPLVSAQDTGDEAEPLQAQAPAETKEKKPWPLYFEVALGQSDADDINNSLSILSTHGAGSLFSIEEQLYSRAAIGWKMPRGKGDFRLTWTGYKEEGYELNSVGGLAAVDPNLPQADQPGNVQDLLPWWLISLEDGQLQGVYLLPQWSPAQDTLEGTFADRTGSRTIVADNNAVDCPQVQLGTPTGVGDVIDGGPACEATFLVDRFTSRTMAADMQNRAETIDLVYGREFGKERYTSHWWVGARYFNYEGNIPTPTWLDRRQTGVGFSEGADLALLNFSQETTGFGPSVAMTVFFNYFERKLSLFLGAQAALMLYDISVGTQNFFTRVGVAPSVLNLPAELREDRDKTSWQNSIEGGVRYSFRNGVQLELAYNFTGFLDVLVLPSEMAVPISQQSTQGVSAIYNTQDYRLSTWRGGVAFQF